MRKGGSLGNAFALTPLSPVTVAGHGSTRNTTPTGAHRNVGLTAAFLALTAGQFSTAFMKCHPLYKVMINVSLEFI